VSQRTKIGWLALVLMSAGAVLLTGVAGDQSSAVAPAFVRVGVVLGALWLAYADLSRVPARLWIAGTAALLVLALRPRWWPVALLVFVTLLLMRPPSKPR